MASTLYEKVFHAHTIAEVADGQYQLAVDIHLLNEVSSPQAFDDLKARGLRVAHPGRTFACADHSISTGADVMDFDDALCEAQVQLLGTNTHANAIHYFDPLKGLHGIIHVVAPEQGLTQPGMVIACGDSHTSTHGAFGTVAFGIGTSQVRDVLATQSLIMEKLKVRRIVVEGELARGVFAKDLALHLIHHLGAKGGLGYAYEFCGSAIEKLSMEERMTLCNMAVEGGARCGYVNPDATTYAYLRGRPYAPGDSGWDEAVARWASFASDPDAKWDDECAFSAQDVRPMITWGTSPDQSIAISQEIPDPVTNTESPDGWREAMTFMGTHPGERMIGQHIDTAFIGSCTNGRLSDLVAVAEFLKQHPGRVAPHVKALIVPGSRAVRQAAIELGLDQLFVERGFEFRDAGCSLCCGMNADRLSGREVCASSSNRNFRGRQGSPTGRTLLMSPVMVAAAALAGEITDLSQSCCTPKEHVMTAIIKIIHGQGVPLPGNDIDTDQIIESRYLKVITFQGIEAYLFESLRLQAKSRGGPAHPLDDPRFRSARILLVNRNFGCGSSREHAPQAIRRFGIQAIIGESFGEIFAGNSLTIGLPCLPVSAEDAQWLQQLCDATPQAELMIDIEAGAIEVMDRRITFDLPEGRRRRLLEGTWDSLDVVLGRQGLVDERLGELPAVAHAGHSWHEGYP